MARDNSYASWNPMIYGLFLLSWLSFCYRKHEVMGSVDWDNAEKEEKPKKVIVLDDDNRNKK